MKKLISILILCALLVALAACSGTTQTPETTTAPGSAEQEPEVDGSVTALTLSGYDITGYELNYHYLDVINQWYSNNGAYASLMGFNASLPLDQQYYDQESGKTWADYFTDLAIDSAKITYAVYHAAQEDGFTLTEDQRADLDTMKKNMQDYVNQNGLNSLDALVESMYGSVSSYESYLHYCEVSLIANYYYQAHGDALMEGYTEEDIQTFLDGKGYQYNAYSYTSIYLALDNFKLGGTKDESGKLTYTPEEEQAAMDYLNRVVQEMAVGDNNTTVKLNAAIALMEDELAAAKGEETPTTHTTATDNTNVLYSKINTVMQEWLRDEARVPGDITAVPYETTTVDADGNETKVLRGYYILIFQDVNDNNFALANVRHILFAFEGGQYDSTTGQTTYTDAEKQQALEKAERLLEQWAQGEATEESFAELANTHSTDPGSNTNGGLYEDIYPGQMVTNFNDWCFDSRREVGDTGIVETNYGYHVMFYSADSDLTYRNYMVTNDMLSQDMSAWQTELREGMEVEYSDTSVLDSSLNLSGG